MPLFRDRSVDVSASSIDISATPTAFCGSSELLYQNARATYTRGRVAKIKNCAA